MALRMCRGDQKNSAAAAVVAMMARIRSLGIRIAGKAKEHWSKMESVEETTY